MPDGVAEQAFASAGLQIQPRTGAELFAHGIDGRGKRLRVQREKDQEEKNTKGAHENDYTP